MSSNVDAAWEARCVLRSARAAMLATQSDGQPYAALVTPAVLPDASVVLLLSGLSEHTRHLRVEPRCALLFTGVAAAANPQTAPRLTVSGQAVPEHDPALKERWLRLHPYAELYASMPDFTLWRVRPASGHFIGGFARAARIPASHLEPDPETCAAVARVEPSILSHCNEDHAQALDDIARFAGHAETGWRMVAVDVDGFDLARGDVVHRVHWAQPVSDAVQVRSELVRLTQEARAARTASVATGSAQS